MRENNVILQIGIKSTKSNKCSYWLRYFKIQNRIFLFNFFRDGHFKIRFTPFQMCFDVFEIHSKNTDFIKVLLKWYIFSTTKIVRFCGTNATVQPTWCPRLERGPSWTTKFGFAEFRFAEFGSAEFETAKVDKN